MSRLSKLQICIIHTQPPFVLRRCYVGKEAGLHIHEMAAHLALVESQPIVRLI
jgi:hypothetical protein